MKKSHTAKPHNRYVGLYHYNQYWQTWFKILGHDDGYWIVQEVNLTGQFIGEIKKHCTEMDARRFAAFPFEVK